MNATEVLAREDLEVNMIARRVEDLLMDREGMGERVLLLHTCFTHIHTQVSTHVPDIFTLMLTHTILMITYMFIHSCI